MAGCWPPVPNSYSFQSMYKDLGFLISFTRFLVDVVPVIEEKERELADGLVVVDNEFKKLFLSNVAGIAANQFIVSAMYFNFLLI